MTQNPNTEVYCSLISISHVNKSISETQIFSTLGLALKEMNNNIERLLGLGFKSEPIRTTEEYISVSLHSEEYSYTYIISETH